MRQSVTTPGGFFIGIGGIATSVLVAFGVYLLIDKPSANDDLRTPQIGSGLAPTKEMVEKKEEAQIKKVEEDRDALLDKAAAKYNGGKRPNIDNLEDFRGVLRMREAEKSVTAADQALNAPSNQGSKTVLAAAMDEVSKELVAKKPAPSAVKADVLPPTPAGAPSLPNQLGGGAHTMVFRSLDAPAVAPAPAPAPAPGAKPAEPAVKPAAPAVNPAPAAAPAPTSAPTVTPAPAPATPAAPAPNRAPLLNGNEPTK